MISCMISLMISQVAEAEAALKMKIRPVNAFKFFQCSRLQLCLLVWIAQGGASSVPGRPVWGVYCTFCFPPDHLGAAKARVHPQLLRQGSLCQQISGEQLLRNHDAGKSLDTLLSPGSSILV